MLSLNGPELAQAPSRPKTETMTEKSNTEAPPQMRHIWIITGPSGCGKSTIAEFLANFFALPYIEGDDYHSEANREKMANGIGLCDDDRWEWLDTLQQRAAQEILSGSTGCVVTCSALKRAYRDIIRRAGDAADNVCVRFVYLRADEELLIKRVGGRTNHFFKDNMVQGQFRDLEEPDATETDVLTVDVSGCLDSVKLDAVSQVNEYMRNRRR